MNDHRVASEASGLQHVPSSPCLTLLLNLSLGKVGTGTGWLVSCTNLGIMYITFALVVISIGIYKVVHSEH
jgi:hypothetical protein